ncbi:putative secretory lipase [Aspergillus egyptiacus]|nr:putative secretory lipase [Aspergillus egyptiacus]
MSLVTNLVKLLPTVLSSIGIGEPPDTSPSPSPTPVPTTGGDYGSSSFYQPPPGYETEAPGTILKYQKPPYVFADPLPKAISDAWQVLYRTTDSFGNPAAAATTILIPHEPDYSMVHAYLSVHDSPSNHCAPSLTFDREFEGSGVMGSMIDSIQHYLIAGSLNQGWIVTVPDYEGLNAAFLANRKGAYITLDALRATLASGNLTGVVDSDETRLSLWGYSGGSMAAGVTAEFYEAYAPELNIVGVALGGTVPDVQSAIDTVNMKPNAGLIPLGLYGLAQEYEELEGIIEEQLVDDQAKKESFRRARHMCFGEGFEAYLLQNMLAYFKDPEFTKKDARVQKVFNDNRMGQRTTRIPLLIYKAILDTTSYVPETDKLVDRYCDLGATVDYRKLVMGEHLTLGITGIPEAIGWLRDRMAGVPVSPNCTESIHLSAITDPTSLEVLGGYVASGLRDLIGSLGDLLSSLGLVIS